MNLHKRDPISAEFERSLERTLSNWSLRQEPPRDARAKLITSAKQAHQERNNALIRLLEFGTPPKPKSEDMAVLFYMPQMSFMSALIHY